MVTKQKDFKLVRGDSLIFSFQVTGLSTPIESVTFSCKETSKDTNYIFQKVLQDGIESMGDGVYTVRVAPEDTEGLYSRRYAYDLEMTVAEDVYTLMIGYMELIPDITRR